MKKMLCVLIAGLILMGMAGCSGDKKNNGKTPVKEEQKFNITEMTSKDGMVFTPDLTTEGTVSKSIPLDSNKVELCGKTYTMPVKVSDLIADGWELPTGNFKDEFQPKRKTNLVSFYMKNQDGVRISLDQAYNDTDDVQKLADCWLTAFSVDHLHREETKVDFVFPGGIVKGSTAKDITSIYGDPNNSEIFTEYSYNLEHQLSYNNHKDSKMSFSYTFEDNGLLRYAKVTAVVE